MDTTIRDNNKRIAEFLGWKYFPKVDGERFAGWRKDVEVRTLEMYIKLHGQHNGYYLCRNHNDLRYYNSWDWLMEAVEKIESIACPLNGRFGVYISSNSCTIQSTKFFMSDKNTRYYDEVYADTKKLATYQAVMHFIDYYDRK